MNLKTIKQKKIFPIMFFALMLVGCSIQPPDYLKMISANELNQIMQAEDIFLVDVHTPKQQHIKGTDLFIPYNQIAKHINQFPKDKNTAIYLYCEGGPMGNTAAKTLYDLGYRNLSNLEGGARAWRKKGLALE